MPDDCRFALCIVISGARRAWSWEEHWQRVPHWSPEIKAVVLSTFIYYSSAFRGVTNTSFRVQSEFEPDKSPAYYWPLLVRCY